MPADQFSKFYAQSRNMPKLMWLLRIADIVLHGNTEPTRFAASRASARDLHCTARSLTGFAKRNRNQIVSVSHFQLFVIWITDLLQSDTAEAEPANTAAVDEEAGMVSQAYDTEEVNMKDVLNIFKNERGKGYW